MTDQVYVGLIACDDQAGLVHQITGVLFKKNVNVTENQEYVDHAAGRFFMRTQFEGSVDPKAVQADLKKVLPANASCQVKELKPREIVVMASKEPHVLGELLLRHLTGDMTTKIKAVISQHDECADLTKRFGIPYHHIPVTGTDRLVHERQVAQTIEKYSPEYLVLARYMRIFSAEFVAKYPQKIVNIHHSFLPAFIGRDPYQQAYERGVKIIGATAHFVTDKLDEGPIITQDVVSVDHTCSAAHMAKLGQDVEKLVMVRGLNLILEDRVLIEGNRTIVFS